MSTTESAPTASPYALRRAEVLATSRPTPGVVRVTFGGPELADLPAAAPDGYLKLFLPRERGSVPSLPPIPADGDIGRWYRTYLAMPDAERPPMRTYTLRRRHAAGMDVDFVLHGSGPGDAWVRTTAPGDRVAFTGPYGLYAPRPGHDAQLLVGDESAVPAMAAVVEALPAGARADVIASAPTPAEEQTWETDGDVRVTWVREGLLDALRDHELPGTHPYAWLAGEASVVRELRRHLVRERGVDKADITFCGYWRRGRSEDQAAAEALAAAERGEDPAEI